MIQAERQKIRVLFLCTGNSCRSQMAEAWTRHPKGDVIEPYSAGIETHGLNPNAANVMAEAGVDISAQHLKHTNDLPKIEFDYVITLCDHASRHCPFFPGKAKIIHFGFDDPPRVAQQANTLEEALDRYRRVQYDIANFAKEFRVYREASPNE